jgi:RNA polymerase sigma-70 factor (ECF subfamily)
MAALWGGAGTLPAPPSSTVALASHGQKRRATRLDAGYDCVVATIDLDEAAPLDLSFAGGDDSVLRAAYDAHGGLIYSFCRRAVGEERAKDVTQDVFVSAWRSRETFDPTKGSLAGWLTGIAKHRVVDHVRSERRHADRRSSVDEAELPVEADTDRIGDRMLVSEALESLPERARDVIKMAYFEGYSHAQIAERTSLPLGTIKSDIKRGLLRIRNYLEESHV